MKIEDKRGWGSLDDYRIGDVVETSAGDFCLVVWSDQNRCPSTGGNPGYNGLVSLRTGRAYHLPAVKEGRCLCPMVRRVSVVLTVTDDSEEKE